MLLIWILRVLTTVYETSASPVTGNDGLRLTLSNLTVISSNISTKSALNIECDTAQYGDNLNITDCKDAKLYISSGPQQLAWVDRHTLYKKAHFALPYRYLGGKSQLLFTSRKGVILRLYI